MIPLHVRLEQAKLIEGAQIHNSVFPGGWGGGSNRKRQEESRLRGYMLMLKPINLCTEDL